MTSDALNPPPGMPEGANADPQFAPGSCCKIAIIGMAGRFPAVNNLAEFWDFLRSGGIGVKTIQPSSDNPLQHDPNFVPRSASVTDAARFDAEFFGILPRQAQEMDPQHRQFLQVCWNALEDAGYRPDATPDAVGVFAGCHMNTYIFQRLAADPELLRSLAYSFPGGNLNAEILNDKDYLATRIAYHLNLRGPAVAVQTACSTSLVAIAQACQNLEANHCRMALAGGACITFPQDEGYLHTEDSILSPDGFCRTFDANAKGTIFGDGVGAVVLKRLVDAEQDGDSIYAVIRGWGLNNDGGNKGGYTAPSVAGQRGAILQAHHKAGVTADTISYVEAHGTGTLVGDPIEIAALTEAFARSTDRTQFCAIGSLKSNFGHLDVAAGVAACMKTALMLHHRQIPASVNFSQPNPRIDFSGSPFIVQRETQNWSQPQRDGNSMPRRAGVSSFGVGGTNAHLVMEEYMAPQAKIAHASPSPQLLCLAARSEETLRQLRQALTMHLQQHPQQSLADISYTLLAGRKPQPYRFATSGRTREQWIAALGKDSPTKRAARNPGLVFLFPGQGSQHVAMAADLYRHDRLFARHFDAAIAALREPAGVDLRPLIFGDSQGGDAGQPGQIDQTAYAQPAVFAVSYALAQWMIDQGLRPDYVVGHSVGEFAAAVVAGIVSLQDGARLIAARGRIMQQLPTGSMLAILAAADEVQARLPPGVELAAFNAPLLNVVAGPTEQIQALQEQIESGQWGPDVTGRMLRTSHAFHSAMMDAAIQPFRQVVQQCQLHPGPGPTMLSTVTGKALTPAEGTSVDYWATQIRQPVQFSDTIARLLEDQPRLVMCEVGPSQALTALVRQQPLRSDQQAIIPLLPHAKDHNAATDHAIAALAELWRAGIDLDADRLLAADSNRTRLHLPTYPFAGQRHWFQTALQTQTAPQSQASPPAEAPPPLPDSGGAAGRFIRDNRVIVQDVVQQQMEIMRRQISLLSRRKYNQND